MFTVRFSGALLLVAAAATGCAQTVASPSELVAARRSYQQARSGPAAQLAPADVQAAYEALRRAEGAFVAEGDSMRTRDLGYIADRRAKIAEARAAALVAEQRKAEAQRRAAALRAAGTDASGERLAQASDQIQQQRRELQEERAAREEAERRAAEAMERLLRIQGARQEERGVVITISGAVLFAFSQAGLLPIASARLIEVAEALKEHPNRLITIEGHTDSVGTEEANRKLSLARAAAVRHFLIAHGVPTAQVVAVGYGEERAVTDNDTPEGRANNRRVEIVIAPPSP